MAERAASQVKAKEPPKDDILPGAPVPDADAPEQAQQEDYWGFGGVETFYFPDKLTFIQYNKMNEGQKAKYELRTQSDFELDRRSGNAKVRIDAAKQRHELIAAAASGWNLLAGGQPVPFTEQNLRRWISVANPAIVADLADEITKANPWTQEDMTAQDIRDEIKNLEQLLAEKEKEEAEKAGSSSK